MEKTLNIDEALYQKLVAFYTENYNLPPLAAKIFVYFSFDYDNEGITFDDLVEVLKASKSSVSCGLQLLQTSDLVIAVNKIDERKRYFKINPDNVKIRFNRLTDNLEKELEILNDLKIYKNKQNINTEKLDLYLQLLNSNLENITQTLKNLYK